MTRMLGKSNQPPCGRCCGAPGHQPVKQAKARERAATQREIAAEIAAEDIVLRITQRGGYSATGAN